ncbi:MAG: ATP synthase F1 subunit delta [Planctomycetota bacterium]|nr:ATP synthase F1 subunit delta [Planctomycetota bacterium]MDA1105907.1 ATP synthase F1 subunit delta [Planctomycetota bacterium]
MPAMIDEVGKVYAQSLFDLAKTAGGEQSLRDCADELEVVAEVSRGNRTFREFLHSPIIDPEKRAASLEKMFGGTLSDLVVRFLLVVNRKGRLGDLEGILAAYEALLEESFGFVEVTVYTLDGKPLEGDSLSVVTAEVERATGRRPVFHDLADPAMIGGIKLRIGDQLIDGSIATRLSRLRTRLIDTGSAAVRENIEKFLN